MTRRLQLLAAVVTAVLVARPALAGPPLLCFPFDIGSARSLPIGAGDWHAIDTRYDVSHLADDTLALLTPETPVIVRMETLRRATLYAGKSPSQASALVDRLRERAAAPSANTALALFDFGYLVETIKQGTFLFEGRPMPAVQTMDGYNLVAKAAAFRDDPAIEFALAVMTRGNTRVADAHRAHLAKALKAAPANPAIEANLGRQFGDEIGRK